MANNVNMAILKGRTVHGLESRALRNYLRDQGVTPPSADAIRQRWRHMEQRLRAFIGRQAQSCEAFILSLPSSTSKLSKPVETARLLPTFFNLVVYNY